jgi:hypothetical protein
MKGMNPPDREIEKRDSIREVKTYLADLDILMPSRKIRWSRKYKMDHEAILKKYSDQFPLYTACNVQAKMMLVNEDSIGYHHSTIHHTPRMLRKVKALIKKRTDLVDYLCPDHIQGSEILDYSIKKNIIVVFHLHLIFSKPVNDLIVRTEVDMNFDHWRFSGDSQWELLEYIISDRQNLEYESKKKNLCVLL